MLRRVLLSATVAVGLLAVAIPAAAVIWGEPDGEGHPHVGLIVFDDAPGHPAWRCTGTLLSPTVVLTAGHCTDGAVAARVWFDSEVTDPTYPAGGKGSRAVEGTPYTHPDFVFVLPNTSDVGVVVLDKPVRADVYGTLPSLGALDTLARERGTQEVLFTIVGYGLQSVVPDLQADRERYVGTTMLVELDSALSDGYNLHMSSNAGEGQGRGGACFGDSGGPVFFEGSNVIAGVGSFVLNENCVGAGYAYRTDIANAQDFILPFLQQGGRRR